MLTRRAAGLGLLAAPLIGTLPRAAWAQDDQQGLDQLEYPPFELIGAPSLFGYEPATAVEIAKAKLIVNNTRKGPAPIDVAKHFVVRFAASDPEAIAQWPRPSRWNPLIVEFFNATSTKANSDMVAWCAAFANWCIERAGRKGTRSASSQSFLSSGLKKTQSPRRGDLAVWTCYDSRNRSLGLGHVAFFEGPGDGKTVDVIGGNQSKDGHSSIISARAYPVFDRKVTRGIGGKRVPCTMKFNTYLALS